jgi:hypothetical protein
MKILEIQKHYRGELDIINESDNESDRSEENFGKNDI